MSTKTKLSRPVRAALIILIVLVLAAAVALSVRLVLFAVREQRNIISLTESDGFETRDSKSVWTTDTQIELFRAAYDNDGDMVFTVEGDEKLIAPGTEQSYSFLLDDKLDYPLSYSVSFEVAVEGTDETLPVEGRLVGGDGRELLPWSPVMELDALRDEGELKAGESREYTLQWRWPFERTEGDGLGENDAFDTMLGDLAVEKELVLRVGILTEAEIKPEEIGKNAIWNGDGTAWALVNLICTALTVLLGGYEAVLALSGRKMYEALEPAESERLIKLRRRKAWSLVPAAGSIAAFALTEDMRLPMAWIDRWTPLMLLILAGGVTAALLTRTKKSAKETVEAP